MTISRILQNAIQKSKNKEGSILKIAFLLHFQICWFNTSPISQLRLISSRDGIRSGFWRRIEMEQTVRWHRPERQLKGSEKDFFVTITPGIENDHENPSFVCSKVALFAPKNSGRSIHSRFKVVQGRVLASKNPRVSAKSSGSISVLLHRNSLIYSFQLYFFSLRLHYTKYLKSIWNKTKQLLHWPRFTRPKNIAKILRVFPTNSNSKRPGRAYGEVDASLETGFVQES